MSSLSAGGAPTLVIGVFALLVVVRGLSDSLAMASLRRRRSPGVGGGTPYDRGSLLAILVSIVVAYLIAIVAYACDLGGLLPAWALPLGVALTAVGIAVRVVAMRTLGRFFSPAIRLVEGQRIVREGLYRWIRHPTYTGLILGLLGPVVVLGSLIGLIAFALLVVPSLAYRIVLEERMLVERFGDDYRAYARSTWRLFPPLV